MLFQSEEITEILRMIENEHLDIRAVTMGISLRGIIDRDLGRTCSALRERVLGCQNGRQLDQWIAAAANATALPEVFDTD